jgi:hypothetical protein
MLPGEAVPIGERGQRRFDRAFGRAMHIEHGAQVHHVEHVQPKVAQAVMHRTRQVCGREHRLPRDGITAHRADLGGDAQLVAVRVQDCFVDVLAEGADAGIRYEERLEQGMVAVPIGSRVQSGLRPPRRQPTWTVVAAWCIPARTTPARGASARRQTIEAAVGESVCGPCASPAAQR